MTVLDGLEISAVQGVGGLIRVVGAIAIRSLASASDDYAHNAEVAGCARVAHRCRDAPIHTVRGPVR